MNTTINNLRSCIVTRNKLDNSLLFRIVKTPQGTILVQNKDKLPGRGAYLSKDKDIILKAKKTNALSRALKCKVPEEVYDQLLELL